MFQSIHMTLLFSSKNEGLIFQSNYEAMLHTITHCFCKKQKLNLFTSRNLAYTTLQEFLIWVAQTLVGAIWNFRDATRSDLCL